MVVLNFEVVLVGCVVDQCMLLHLGVVVVPSAHWAIHRDLVIHC